MRRQLSTPSALLKSAWLSVSLFDRVDSINRQHPSDNNSSLAILMDVRAGTMSESEGRQNPPAACDTTAVASSQIGRLCRRDAASSHAETGRCTFDRRSCGLLAAVSAC